MASKKRGSSGEDQKALDEEGGDETRETPRRKPAAKPLAARSSAGRPRLKASHASAPSAGESPAPRRPLAKPRKAVVDLSSTSVDTLISGREATRADSEKRSAKKQAALVGAERKAKAPSAEKKGNKKAAPSGREASNQARELAMALAMEGIEKKAIGIEILDVSGKIDYADFLVVMTGRSDRHVQAIASGLEEAMKRKKISPLSVEGREQANWVLMDYGDVVVHVFQEDTRRLYDIEGLWMDAGRLSVPAEGADKPEKTSPSSPV